VTSAWRKPGAGWRPAKPEDLALGHIVAVHPTADQGGWWKVAQVLGMERGREVPRVQVAWLPRRFGAVATATFPLHRVRLLPEPVVAEIREAEIFPAPAVLAERAAKQEGGERA
jgi:hypothetical protein